jgi:hypothetical protein
MTADAPINPDAPQELTPDRFIAVYVNDYGERLLLVQQRGGQPTLYHSDMDDAPRVVDAPRQQALGFDGVKAWTAGGVILAAEEATWLTITLTAAERWFTLRQWPGRGAKT